MSRLVDQLALFYLERMIVKSIHYEVISEDNLICIKNLCNKLIVYQKFKADINAEWFDNMCFETRMIPSVKCAKANHIIAAKDDNEIVGYAYSNISAKNTYSGGFATLEPVNFFDFDSVKSDEVGCLSQFYIKEGYRNFGIGFVLFEKSMYWLNSFKSISIFFIFVSNGNNSALKFYQSKGFMISHQILDGFITVLVNPVKDME